MPRREIASRNRISLCPSLYTLYIEKRRNIWRILISIPSSHSASRLLENIWDNIFPAFSSRFSRLLLPILSRFQPFFGVFRFYVSFSRIFSIITFAICWLWCISLHFWHLSHLRIILFWIQFLYCDAFHLAYFFPHISTLACLLASLLQFFLSYYFQVSCIRFRVTYHTKQIIPPNYNVTLFRVNIQRIFKFLNYSTF